MIIVVLIFVLTAVSQFPVLMRKKFRKELVVFSVLYIVSFVLCSLYALDVKIPSINEAVMNFIENVLHLSYSLK